MINSKINITIVIRGHTRPTSCGDERACRLGQRGSRRRCTESYCCFSPPALHISVQHAREAHRSQRHSRPIEPVNCHRRLRCILNQSSDNLLATRDDILWTPSKNRLSYVHTKNDSGLFDASHYYPPHTSDAFFIRSVTIDGFSMLGTVGQPESLTGFPEADRQPFGSQPFANVAMDKVAHVVVQGGVPQGP